MICFRLRCGSGHEFDGWFRSSADFDEQSRRGLLTCATCGEAHVEKALMAPRLNKKANARSEAPMPAPAAASPTAPAVLGSGSNASLPVAKGPPASLANLPPAEVRQFVDMVRKLRAAVEANSENVGDKFTEEARRIHYDEVEARNIYGQATLEEARELLEEGIDVTPLPSLPDDHN